MAFADGSGSRDEILDLGWVLNLITGILIRRGEDPRRHRRVVIWRQRQRIEWCSHKPSNASSHQNLGAISKKKFYGKSLWREHGPTKTLILYFWTPELWKNKCLVYEATRFVVLCYNGPWKLIQNPFREIHNLPHALSKIFNHFIVFGSTCTFEGKGILFLFGILNVVHNDTVLYLMLFIIWKENFDDYLLNDANCSN